MVSILCRCVVHLLGGMCIGMGYYSMFSVLVCTDNFYVVCYWLDVKLFTYILHTKSDLLTFAPSYRSSYQTGTFVVLGVNA